MNLTEVKKALDSFSERKNSGKSKEELEKIFWKPTYGRHQIRIVPSKYFPDLPCHKVMFYYGIAKHPMTALTNFDKQDPIQEFIEQLRQNNDKDSNELAYKLSAKARFFAPVIVRGEEEKGVRLWGLSATVNKKLLDYASDEEIGDYTDPANGFDLKMIYEEGTGGSFATTDIDVARKSTPLSDDADQIDEWLQNQPHPTEDQPSQDYEYIKKQLENYVGSLVGGEEEEEEEGTPNSTEGEKSNEESKGSMKLEDKQEKPVVEKKKKKAESFDDLFD